MPKNKIVKSDKTKENINLVNKVTGQVYKTAEEKLQYEAVNCVLTGAPRSLVISKLMNDSFECGIKLSQEEAEQYVNQIDAALTKIYEEKKKKMPEFLLNSYLNLYQEARAFGDRKTAISCLSSLERICGIGADKSEKIQINSEGKVNISFGFGGDKEEDDAENKDGSDFEYFE